MSQEQKCNLLDRTLRSLVAGLSYRLGMKTLSDAHLSSNTITSESTGPMVFLSGFPRSGTTTFMRAVAKTLDYNYAFEPFGFNHCGSKHYKFANASFRGNSTPEEIALQKAAGGSFACLHTLDNEALAESLRQCLRALIVDILEYFGNSVVLKELRLIANLPTVDSVLSELGVPVRYIMLKVHPLMTLYTHYRLGMLADHRCWNVVDSLHERRVSTYYNSRGVEHLVGWYCKSRWEKLIVSALLDQYAMRQFNELNSERSVMVDFQAGIKQMEIMLADIGFCDVDKPSTTFIYRRRYAEDKYFLRLLHQQVGKELRELVEQEMEDVFPAVSSGKGGRRRFFTYCGYRIQET